MHSCEPQIGQIVKVNQGRGNGSYSVIIAVEDERYVLIADGRKRKFDHPKRKNRMHLELTSMISREVADSMRETGRVTNGKLRYALSHVTDDGLKEAQEKGE